MAQRHPAPRAALLAGWNRLLGETQFPIKASWIGETPLIASHALVERLDKKLTNLLTALRPHLARRDDPEWPLAPAADVLSADVAIVESQEAEGGWDLRWVEFQAFTSLVSMIYTLHQSAVEVWPELGDLKFWGTLPEGRNWIEATRQWMAPTPGSVLLEHAPCSQPTAHDFEAARHWFDLSIVTPDKLRVQSGRLDRLDAEGRWIQVPHVANRLILHVLPERARIAQLLASVSPTWNSHPVWYYRINKGTMATLPLSPEERCATADRWRDLGMPAEALVAKPIKGFAGRGILLHVDEPTLAGLPSPESWIVQPRFSAAALLDANDGAPLFGEIRCVLAIPRNGEHPWLVCRLARMARDARTSAAAWTGAAGEGAVPVYAPPD